MSIAPISQLAGPEFWTEAQAEMDRSILPPKLCIDCIHHKEIRPHQSAKVFHVCQMRLHALKIDPVTGSRHERWTNCHTMRRHENLCGIEAKHFSAGKTKGT